MDESCHDLRKRRMRYEYDACRRRRGVIRRALARIRRERVPVSWWQGPDLGGGDFAGVREPRRPVPSAGSAAMALEIPRSA
jgi:hypothetical protein